MMSHFPLLAHERTATGFRARVAVPRESPFFRGHFPGRPILSAVAQLTLLRETVEACLERPIAFTAVEGARFRQPVLPGDEIELDVNVHARRLRFAFSRASELLTNGRVTLAMEVDAV